MRNILIVYFNVESPVRASTLDHLYAFKKYSGARCYYLNIAVGGVPFYLQHIDFDLIIFHTILLSIRWHRQTFIDAVKKIRVLKKAKAVKVALPQDEFVNMDLVCEFINEFQINHIFSVAEPSEWQTIYRTVNRDHVTFHEVFTGYLESSTVKRIEDLSHNVPQRSVDIGYRAWKAEPWLGRHGFLKTRIAEVFQEVAPLKHLKVDISTLSKDTLYGDDWYRFLLQCRYTIGVEGGASLLDWDGTVRERSRAYLELHPNASFTKIEAACFPGLDGQLNLRAISPRQLEACATKTCQILIEGRYGGVLKPGVHYVALKRDFSNMESVLNLIRTDAERNQIVENAYRDIVLSGRYGYDRFVQFVLEASLSHEASFFHDKKQQQNGSWLMWRWISGRDKFSWFMVRLICCFSPLKQKLILLLVKTSIGQRLRKRRQLLRESPL